jgi:hypothetical protein
MKKQRTPYQPDQALQLQRIEERRQRHQIPHEDLADAADIPLSTYRRIRRRNRATRAQVNNLRFAIRTILKRRADAGLMFEGANG